MEEGQRPENKRSGSRAEAADVPQTHLPCGGPGPALGVWQERRAPSATSRPPTRLRRTPPSLGRACAGPRGRSQGAGAREAEAQLWATCAPPRGAGGVGTSAAAGPPPASCTQARGVAATWASSPAPASPWRTSVWHWRRGHALPATRHAPPASPASSCSSSQPGR